MFTPQTASAKASPTDIVGRLGSNLESMRTVISDLGCVVGGAVRLWRHRKRGTTYVEIGRASVQASTGPLVEGDTVVMYRDKEGRVWVRKESEFEDGRFEEV